MSMDKIEHVVLLMLENRSFDSMLGWLYEQDQPNVVIPPAAPDDLFRGLRSVDPACFTNVAMDGRVSSPPIRGAAGYTVPTVDPGEEFQRVNMQFFGTENPGPEARATMTGYISDYVEVMRKMGIKPDDKIAALAPQVMQSYTPGQLPVLNQLAKHYAVSDAWFASVPSQTNPNRAFAMCGTSHGLVNNGELETDDRARKLEAILGTGIGDDRFPDKTIFNAVHDAGADWKVFWQTSYLPRKISTLLGDLDEVAPLLGPAMGLIELIKPYENYIKELTSGALSSCYTWRLFPAIHNIPNAAANFHDLTTFHAMARAGELPKFSYIEPFWTISQTTVEDGAKALATAMGNDYHPPGNLIVAENFLRDVYASLIANPDAWAKTLLIITFDEFVGCFDHVAPPAATPPWGHDGHPPEPASPTGFPFNRLGGRVPAILVSPYIAKGAVVRAATEVTPFDHTSIIATVLKWLGQEAAIPGFGQRAAGAPTFGHALSLDVPRTDAAAIGFLRTERAFGDPVGYGDRFVLRNPAGKYITTARLQMKEGLTLVDGALLELLADLEAAAWFPTIDAGDKAPLMFLTSGADHPATVQDGDAVWLVTNEPGVVARNFLGAAASSHDCFYDESDLGEAFQINQTWNVTKIDNPGQGLRYGERLYLVNQKYDGQRLTQDTEFLHGRWITTATNGDWWVVEPVPSATA